MRQLTIDDWQPMSTAALGPGRAEWVEIELPDHTVVVAHYAYDENGEEQPPFRGWFRRSSCGTYNVQVPNPIAWRPLRGKRRTG